MSKQGESVALVRKHLRITQAAMGRLMGVHPQTVSDWERGALKLSNWHRTLLILLSQSQPRPNLEERLRDPHSNPILALAHLLSDHVRSDAARSSGSQAFSSPLGIPSSPPSTPPRIPLPRINTRQTHGQPRPNQTPQMPEAAPLPALPTENSRFALLEVDDDDERQE